MMRGSFALMLICTIALGALSVILVGHTGGLERTQGITTIPARNADVQVLAIPSANWKRTEGHAVMQALREKDLAGKIPVAGTGVTP